MAIPGSSDLDSLYKDLGLPEVPEPEKIPMGARKPVVARFITIALISLFVGQMAVITLAYVGIVLFGDKASLEQTTSALLDSVSAIVPVTTTLLGVVIGFYFREEVDSRDDTSSPPQGGGATTIG